MITRFHPTTRALVIAGTGFGVALLAVLVSPALAPVWVVFWFLLALALGIDLLLLGSARSLRAELELPTTLAIGATQQVPLRVERRKGRTLIAEAAFTVDGHLDPLPAQQIRIEDGVGAALVPFRAHLRGPVRATTISLRYPGPLGLMRCTVELDSGAESVVVPDLAPVQSAAVRFFGSSDYRSGLKIERLLGEGSEFESLREYLPGHDPRAIDWKASARHKRLFVRQFRAERNHQIVLAMDVGRLMAEPVEGLPKLDHAIHAALLLGYVGLRTGDRVGAHVFDSQFRGHLAPRAGVHSFAALRAALSALEYGTEETNFTVGLTDLAARLDRRSLVVILTDFVDSVTAELMVDNLDRLARRHLLLFVALRDPLLGRIARGEPKNAAQVHQAAVVHGFVRERERVLRRLRRAGILCVDAEPSEVRTGLLNRYLDVKRRERIG